MFDIIIIGAGTAGLSAAIYGIRAGKKVLVLEQASYGGQIINTPEVENYPGIRNISGYQFAANLYEQVKDLGGEIRLEKVVKLEDKKEKKQVTTLKEQYEGRSVIIATGARNRPLGLEREAELTGRGISYCATCDGAFFRGKPAAVAGGGNTALEDASFLANGCTEVYLIHRRDQFRGEERLERRLREKKNVHLKLQSQVVGLHGENKLEAIEIENAGTKERALLVVSALFVAIGQIPETETFAGLLSMDSYGYIQASEDCSTSIPGIFAAGDCRTKAVRQLATAAADGAVAALAACEYAEHQ